jgi:hypothetical protein
MSLAIWPPAMPFIIRAARFNTFTVFEMSTPFSNRVAASVRKLWRKEVFRISSGLNQALSRNILTVLFLTRSAIRRKPCNTHGFFGIANHQVLRRKLSFLLIQGQERASFR